MFDAPSGPLVAMGIATGLGHSRPILGSGQRVCLLDSRMSDTHQSPDFLGDAVSLEWPRAQADDATEREAVRE
jgi:hypothetical protein